MVTKIDRYLVNHSKLLHFIISVIPITIVVPLVIVLPLWLILSYRNLLAETAYEHTWLFIGAFILGLITSTCSVVWIGRKTWLEVADIFPPDQDEPED